MKENIDPRLYEVADWLNSATEEEQRWSRYIWLWFQDHIQREEKLSYLWKANFVNEVLEEDIFPIIITYLARKPLPAFLECGDGALLVAEPGSDLTPGQPGPSVSYWTDSQMRLLLDFDEIISDPPDMPTEGSCKKVAWFILLCCQLWNDRLLDITRCSPRLRHCPECKKWFIASKTNQTYCTYNRGECREVALRGRAGEQSERRERYKQDQKQKMKKLREVKRKLKEQQRRAKVEAALQELRNSKRHKL